MLTALYYKALFTYRWKRSSETLEESDWLVPFYMQDGAELLKREYITARG